MAGTYDWLVVGGGIQGILLSHWLISYKVSKAENICILDRHEDPLHCWRARTTSVGMNYLRSPSVHHLDLDPFGLHKFARFNSDLNKEPFAPPYSRPSLQLFTEHCNSLLKTNNLKSIWKKGDVHSAEATEEGFTISTDTKKLQTKHLVLALGSGDELAYPEWVHQDLLECGKIQHIFQESFDRSSINQSERIIVVGGGITAAQIAIALSANLRNKVELYSRHALRKHEFDSGPCWVGPKCMRKFDSNKSMKTRRHLITKARNRGSISSEVDWMLQQALRAGKVSHKIREIRSVDLCSSGMLQVKFTGDAPPETVDRIILATGFSIKRPGGDFIDNLISSQNLPIAECGFPILNRDLTWTKNIHVMGSLAELELGPSARNIVGGRKAAERIITSLK